MYKEKILSIKDLIKASGLPGFLLLFNNILSFFITRKRDLEDYSSVDASALFQVAFVFIVFGLAFHTLVFKSRIKGKLLVMQPNVFLLLFIMVCFLSVLWTPNINLSLYRAFETLTYLILISWTAYNLSTRLDAQNIIEWVVFWAVWSIFWAVATSVKLIGIKYLVFPFYAARLQYPIAIFFALLLSKRKLFKYIILVFALLSFSNKIYLGFALGLTGVLFGNSKSKGLILIFVIALATLLLFLDFETILTNTVFIGREGVGLEHSSGRNYVWDIAWEAFKESPIIGYGFVSGENEVLYAKFTGAINTHSFLFSGLLGTGLIGTIFLILYYFSIFKVGLNKYWPKNNWKVAIIGTLIMSLVVSLSAPGVGSRVYGSWIGVVFIITVVAALNIKFKYYYKRKKSV